MIVWQGFGIITLIIPVIILVIGQASFDAAMGEGFYTSHPWTIALCALLSAAAIWFVGDRLNNAPGKILIDPETGEQVELKAKHSLFWIPMQWFAVPVAAIGILLAYT